MGLSSSSATSISGPLIPSLLTRGTAGAYSSSNSLNPTQPQQGNGQQDDADFTNFNFVSLNPAPAPTIPGSGFSDDIFINAFYGAPSEIFSRNRGSAITNLAFGGGSNGSRNNQDGTVSGLGTNTNSGLGGLDNMF